MNICNFKNPLGKHPIEFAPTKGAGSEGGMYGLTRNNHTKPHKGIDLKAPIGTPVYASKDGTVEVAGKLDGYGNAIYINHDDGTQTRYAHLKDFQVKVGDKVVGGEEIGHTGNTGNAAHGVPHLHYEIRDMSGKTNDPTFQNTINPIGLIDPTQMDSSCFVSADSEYKSALTHLGYK